MSVVVQVIVIKTFLSNTITKSSNILKSSMSKKRMQSRIYINHLDERIEEEKKK